eukprot:TRINITY_DN41950_c0_g1_i1.p1 TRINITY_DN41950_c0_g1~~TRINITY_DN41950_c0_g1_i1.p1  ORF type:complete len:332 (+),score=14.60 TRINITY_DN41950_c0_g1_i1:58-996(+)
MSISCLRQGRQFHIRPKQAQAACLSPEDRSSAAKYDGHISCAFIRNSTSMCEWFTRPQLVYWRSQPRDFPNLFGEHNYFTGVEKFWSCCPAVRKNPYEFFQRIFTAEIRLSWPGGDIAGHLPFLRTLAAQQSTTKIVEFGTRKGTSTLAFLLGLADQVQLSRTVPSKSSVELTSYDVEPFRYAKLFQDAGRLLGISYSFRKQSSLKVQIPPIDILFIDTLHTYGLLRRELALHQHAVKHYIVLHDTEVWGEKTSLWDIDLLLSDPDTAGWPEEDYHAGLLRAVREFLQVHSEWQQVFHFKSDNGLTVLARSS